MPEESHLEEMRAAIKADRERAVKRGRVGLTSIARDVTPSRGSVLVRLRRFLLQR